MNNIGQSIFLKRKENLQSRIASKKSTRTKANPIDVHFVIMLRITFHKALKVNAIGKNTDK